VDAGLAVIAAIAVGVPLLALVVVRRLPAPRRRPTFLDAEYDLARRFRLGAPDHIRVQDAVREGRRVQPERLVPAAREYAELVLGRCRPVRGRRLPPRMRRLLGRTFLLAYGCTGVASFPHHPLILFGFVAGVGSAYFSPRDLVQTRVNAERALPANQDERDITNGTCTADLPTSLT
jgi:hypothetical protein